MSLTEQFKTMGTSTQLNENWGVDEVNERLVEAVVTSLPLGVVIRKALSETPVIVISPDVRTRRDRDKNRRGCHELAFFTPFSPYFLHTYALVFQVLVFSSNPHSFQPISTAHFVHRKSETHCIDLKT